MLDRYFTPEPRQICRQVANATGPGRRAIRWPRPVAGTLRSFQSASQIRDAFFAAGGAQPSFMVTVTPPAVTDPNVTAKIEFYGTPIVSQARQQRARRRASWPGAGSYQIKITVATDAPPPRRADRQRRPDACPAPPPAPPPPEVSMLVNKKGVWALFRLLDDAARGGNRGDAFSAAGRTTVSSSRRRPPPIR